MCWIFFSQGLVSFDGLLSLKKSLKMVIFFFFLLFKVWVLLISQSLVVLVLKGLRLEDFEYRSGKVVLVKPSSPRSEGVKARRF